MAPQLDYFIDDEDVAAGDQSNSFAFIVPPDAVVRGNINDPSDDKARATWQQQLEIIECKWYEDETFPQKNDPKKHPCITAEIKFQVPPDARRTGGIADPNSGKSHLAWYRVIPGANKNAQHPRYKQHNFAQGTLNGILRSIWGSAVFPPGQKHNLGQFFGGDKPAVLGRRVYCTVKATRYEGERKDELRDFVPFELQSK